ncbi:pimeloyl-ACP methyl ester carboxylesterase [Sagittula marina]|uniref:Pimeloyl-ACP methyl ester carboxylesterase n=2 Tax=Sagittula marina TaxID=943940 RepID=A0A7W6DL05_9RHOB|nr:alpha/beta hydrolase [Sagittula marina]MBB3985165.1 pimeloyl-ACP methyl ester carboxylesterase [Sagittula marina]
MLGLYVLGGAVAAWGLSHLRATQRTRAAEAAFPPEGRFVEVDGTRVHYVTRGKGPDVVLIHGMSGNLRDMTFSLMDRLAQDYRVTAFDRPGMGYTDSLHEGGETLVEQATLLMKASRALGLAQPVVMGQSYGGSVALAWAVEFPETLSALVLVASPSHPWDGGMSWLYRINSHRVLGPMAIPFEAAWVPKGYIKKAIAGVFNPQDMPPGYDAHIGADLTIRPGALRANALHRAGLLDQISAQAQRYSALAMPIELIHGNADDTVPLHIHSEPLATKRPNAHLTVLEGIGHMPHHAREGAVVEAVHRAHRRAVRS